MRTIGLAWFCGALALAGVLTASSRDRALPGPIPAEMVRVIDGDTLAVRARIWLDQDVTTLVRIDGIDTPELDAACAAERARGLAAQAALAWLVGADPVALSDVDYDKYGGRVRAKVTTAAGADVAETLIAAGLARAYAGGARQPWCAADGTPLP